MNHQPGLTRRREAGTTLVEMLVALVIVGFVALTAGFIHLVNQRALTEGKAKLHVQQNVSRCLDTLTRDIREAWRADLVGGDKIVLYDVNGVLTSTWEAGPVDGVVRLKRNSLAVAPEECSALLFDANADTSTVTVELELKDRSDNKVRILSRSTLRNFVVEGV